MKLYIYIYVYLFVYFQGMGNETKKHVDQKKQKKQIEKQREGTRQWVEHALYELVALEKSTLTDDFIYNEGKEAPN